MKSCSSCKSPKAPVSCECCGEPLCKSCVQTLEENAFSFYKKVPKVLSYTRYCSSCFHTHVLDAQTKYDDILSKAKDVYIFYVRRKGVLPIFEQSKQQLKIEPCSDKDEAILRLAFLAAERGFNAITETDVVCKKIRDGAYQTSEWSASGFPAKIDTTKVDRH